MPGQNRKPRKKVAQQQKNSKQQRNNSQQKNNNQQRNNNQQKNSNQQKKNKKVVPYRKPLNMNVGMIIFALIFVYMVFSIYTYVRRDKVQFYEVQEGSIVNNTEYTGIILRQEHVKNTDKAGYINYYIREGKRASVGTRVYSIDETGNVSSLIAENAGESMNLTDENVSSLKKQLTTFSLTYHDNQFASVYDTKYALDASVLECMNFNSADLDSMIEKAGGNFEQVRADEAGIISYGIDSYESLTAAGISESVFDRGTYAKTIAKSGDLKEIGLPVYKIITSDLWSCAFLLEEKDVEQYKDKSSLGVSFKGRDLTLSGAFSTFTGTDGKTYGLLEFDKYMIQFVSDRYVEFEIVSDKAVGLKIPVTAVTDKQFYLIPSEYLTTGGGGSESGFNKETYTDSGTSVVFVPTTIYYLEGDNYYVESGGDTGLNSGDYVVKANSTERYQLGASASLQGVYNINKGYAVFKQIDVISFNDEYNIVKKNMQYGLSVYDHIVLDASTVTEGELIYQ